MFIDGKQFHLFSNLWVLIKNIGEKAKNVLKLLFSYIYYIIYNF